jgi:hypothetical protein
MLRLADRGRAGALCALQFCSRDSRDGTAEGVSRRDRAVVTDEASLARALRCFAIDSATVAHRARDRQRRRCLVARFGGR